jgi:3-hydroxyisobutyrate dehydrogenase-like beta-hydroxyacid dehydrogenase|tara:strand:- start:3714 stop:4580 length:867 start_codon:yes stop_codon:yes gene_type:complete
MKNIGFIGLGVMGSPMAGHISNAGYRLKVFNRTREKAELWSEEYSGEVTLSPAELAEGCDMVFLCVGNNQDVEEIVQGKNGVLEGLKAGGIIVDHTTTSSVLARTMSVSSSKKGISFIDAPVSGGEIGAKEGTLTIMAGGDEEAFKSSLEVINLYSKYCKRMGESGSGQLTKMVNQICIAGLIQGLAEGMHFSEKAGLDTKEVIEVISKGAAQSWQMENRWETMLSDFYEHGFAVDWMRKDLGFVLEEAIANGSNLKVTALVDTFYAEIQQKGGGRWDTSSLFRRLRS